MPDSFVVWLQIVPISQHEYDYAADFGADVLEDMLVEAQIDTLNLYRESII
ncbi:MAG: suppressor of fused domain protein [Candidatus Promineifilaceae bacterium]